MKIAVPVLGKIANFDDLDPLRAEPEVDLVFVRKGERLPDDAALVILPGSKSTIADMAEFGPMAGRQISSNMCTRGGEVHRHLRRIPDAGKDTISDPDGIEGDVREIKGLGLLDIETVLEGEKITRNSQARSLLKGILPLDGYEIHIGRTKGPDCERPMIRSENGVDGAVSHNGKVRGCYLHGLFESDAFAQHIVQRFGISGGGTNYRAKCRGRAG